MLINEMTEYSSAQAARKLGITAAALSKYIKARKVPAPRTVQIGKLKVQAWTEEEIEHVRKLLPKIANGRKTRWQKKKQSAGQQSAKAKKKPKRKPKTRK